MHLIKFLEDRLVLFIRDADPGVRNMQGEIPACGLNLDRHASLIGKLDAIADQVLKDSLQLQAVGFDHQTLGAINPHFQTLGFDGLAEPIDHLMDQFR